MGIEDLFENGHNRQRYGYEQHYGHDNQNHLSRQNNQQYETKLKMINSLVNNPKIRLMIILAAIVILAIIVLLIILLFPLLIKLFSNITENGIQGILNTIWKGTK